MPKTDMLAIYFISPWRLTVNEETVDPKISRGLLIMSEEYPIYRIRKKRRTPMHNWLASRNIGREMKLNLKSYFLLYFRWAYDTYPFANCKLLTSFITVMSVSENALKWQGQYKTRYGTLRCFSADRKVGVIRRQCSTCNLLKSTLWVVMVSISTYIALSAKKNVVKTSMRSSFIIGRL